MSTRDAEARLAERFAVRVRRYFSDCAAAGTPATPSGLALALDMRTSDLNGAHLPEAARRTLNRALQRIETETMERALNGKNGAKGMEVVLQQTAALHPEEGELETLSDEELARRMAAAAEEIGRALESGPS